MLVLGKQRQSQIKKRILYLAYLLLLSFFLLGLGRTPLPPPDYVAQGLDFSPESGNYNISANGTPLDYSEVKHFLLSLRLDKQAPTDITFTYEIKANRDFWPDSLLGELVVMFPANTLIPTITYASAVGGAAMLLFIWIVPI